MSKKMKICLTALTLAVVMVFLTVAVCAADFNWYKQSYLASGTQILKGSIQANKSADYSEFTTLYSALRYDPSGTAGPGAGYQGLYLKIFITAYRLDENDHGTIAFKDSAESSELTPEGSYIHTTKRTIVGQGVDQYIGTFYWKANENTNYNAGFIIDTEVDNIS